MMGEKVLAKPLVAAFVALLVRVLAYTFRVHISIPYHFGITTPNTAAEIWREAIFWRYKLGSVPDYLAVLAPWYTEFIPPAPAEVYVTILCLCDAITAFFVSQWPSARPHFVFTFFVLNPVMVLLPALESLAPVEHLLLAVVVECCRRRKLQPWLVYIARFLAPALGYSFAAVVLALWFPVGKLSPTRAILGAIFGAAIIALFGLLFLWQWGGLGKRIPLYIPPDNGVIWYVRLLSMPLFQSCMVVFQNQIPVMLALVLAIALPAETDTAPAGRMGSIPGDRRLTLVLVALCISKMFRIHLALPDYSLIVLFVYALLDTTGKRGLKGDRGRSMWERIQKANMFVPVCAIALVIPLQYTFYTGWIMWDMINPNWIFFTQVGFIAGGVVFMAVFFNAVVDAIKEETEVGEKKVV